MTPSAGTGRIVPAWIRDQVRRYEAAWPMALLAAAVAAALSAQLILGGVLWTTDAVVYYARP